jgi:hypothetical protein
MSDPSEAATERITVREAAGVFRSREALETAVGALLESGFDRSDIDLMASVHAVVEKLGGLYAPAEELADVPEVPRRAFLAREDIIIPMAAAGGILTYLGAIAGTLGVVASGGRWHWPLPLPARAAPLPAASPR